LPTPAAHEAACVTAFSVVARRLWMPPLSPRNRVHGARAVAEKPGKGCRHGESFKLVKP
jgi:hypothetical protein